MRPIRLTLQAFGPFAGREVVDFRGALGSGLFGVYGRTGAGKSTIFSAMTFALFGEPARSEQQAPSLRSDHADPAMPTEVELVFDIGPRRYVVRRRPEQTRPKARGRGETRDPHEAYLFDATGLAVEDITRDRHGKVLAEKKVGAVREAVEELLGYRCDQFRQIVLLPQGRFESFLAADTKERLAILRDLFDVSLYRALTATLKERAETAERRIREERAVCAARLAADDFENLDALAAGLDAAGTELIERRHAEAARRAAAAAAQTALDAARALDRLFAEATAAAQALAAVKAHAPDMAALADRLAQAERARALADVAREADAAEADLTRAVAAETVARNAADKAAAAAGARAATLSAERGRAAETEALRRALDHLDRCAETLDAAAGLGQAADAAERAARAAAEALAAAQTAVERLATERSSQADDLKAARNVEAGRAALAVRLTALEAALTAAETFEAAIRAVEEAETLTATRRAEQNAAASEVAEAGAALAGAEAALAAAQAAHLATRLVPGEPCPVCGGAEHPAPAADAPAAAGLDPAFRRAKSAIAAAETRERTAAGALAAAEAMLTERRARRAALAPPDRPVAALRADRDALRRALADLGPATDLAAAEAALDAVAARTAEAEAERDRRQEIDARTQADAAAARARLSEALSTVPEDLRDRPALDRARADRRAALDARRAALEAAEAAAASARDAAVAAARDREAAAAALAERRDRREAARRRFDARLAENGLSEAAFRALIPDEAALAADRAALDAHRDALAAARHRAVETATAVEGRIRPDMSEIEAALAAAEAARDAAADARAAAENRLAYLQTLRDSLAESLARLDAEEAETGPLRALAALFDAHNRQRLDLETFALGALFDGVLEAANRRLGPMTAGRYTLRREIEGAGGRARRGLGIEAFDIFTGKARPTATLSGGETFIAALALALGLADMVESANGKVRLDAIFIDEGFGSLDSEHGAGTLDQVLQALNALATGSRAVGIVSHVPLVQEAIPNGFYIRRDRLGSRIETHGGD